MKDALPPSLIDVQKLRIGMFVHLDVGWMAHPFPLSSFKISSAEQIATIRGLGKPSVRWSPDKSDPDPRPCLPALDWPAPDRLIPGVPMPRGATPCPPRHP